MTRSIEFRAWDKEEKEYYNPILWDGNVYHNDDFEIGITTDDPVYQYTGLKDKNGVKIFENNILKVHIFTEELGENMGVCEGEKEFIAKVVIGDNGCGVCLINSSDDNSGPIWSYGGIHEESFEIIGCIHTTPELLKESN